MSMHTVIKIAETQIKNPKLVVRLSELAEVLILRPSRKFVMAKEQTKQSTTMVTLSAKEVFEADFIKLFNSKILYPISLTIATRFFSISPSKPEVLLF